MRAKWDNAYDNWRDDLWEQHNRDEQKMLYHEKYWLEIECSLEEKLEDYHEDYVKAEIASLEQQNIGQPVDWMYKAAIELWGQECADKMRDKGVFKCRV